MATLSAPSTFEAVVRQFDLDVDASELFSLIEGVAAAPPAADADEWIALVGENLPDRAKAALKDLLQNARKRVGGRAGEPTDPARLDGLRQELMRAGVDGFIVPRCDAHQGEYVSSNAERLAWLTGFTGSAGMAVVLAERAALFVDGRYTLQARDQVDTVLFEVCHMSEQPATEWIARHLPKGAKLAYDPWLLTPAQVTRYRAACAEAGASLAATEGNLLDRIWTDRPSDPLAPINPHPLTYSGREAADKRLQIGQQLARQKLDAVFLTAPDSIAWLLNVRGGDVPFTPFALSFCLLHADGTADWFVDPRKLTGDVRPHLGNGVTVRAPEDLAGALENLGKRKAAVLLSPADHPDWVFKHLEAAGARIQPGADPCQLIKAAKNTTEIDGMRQAHLRDGAAVCRFLAWLDKTAPGGDLSEMAAADQLESYRRQNALFRGLSFPTISGAGPNGAIVHYRVTEKSNRRLDQDSLLLVDSGAQYLDGTTDITRTIAIGTPSPDMRRAFTLVLKGHIALARARFPEGTSGSQLDVLARAALWQAGLDYDHGTGHGVGAHLSVHEGPQRISKLPNSVALVPGMVISNEPGYYREGSFGIRIENLVCVRPARDIDGGDRPMLDFETLTFAPIDKRAIEVSLLDETERQWLNGYHRQVFENIAPRLDAADAGWLEQATAAL